MTIFVLLIIGGLAAALYHSSTIAQQKSDELTKLFEELKKLQVLNEEITQSYRDALESLRECKDKEPDHNPTYY